MKRFEWTATILLSLAVLLYAGDVTREYNSGSYNDWLSSLSMLIMLALTIPMFTADYLRKKRVGAYAVLAVVVALCLVQGWIGNRRGWQKNEINVTLVSLVFAAQFLSKL